jgi:catechol 2,3-dioxygenase-like lactoylglutathione lyase family enzyme
MESPLQVTGIDHVVFHVKDLARAKKFYVDLLGMKVAHESSWQAGEQSVALFEVDEGEQIHGGSEVNHTALRLTTGDYEKVKAVLEASGFKVTGRTGDPHCIYFSDPDGHRLQLLTPEEWQ